MLIGIDAHNLEGKRTGVGRYLFNILKEWKKVESEIAGKGVKFILYFKDEIPSDIPESSLFEKRLLKTGSTAKFIHWDLRRTAEKDKTDILFCPNYIGPLFYRGKIAVTLHDVSYEAHPKWFNWNSRADRILLKWVSKKIAQKAKMIFVPLEFSKKEVMKHYGIAPEKIFITPEAVDPELVATSRELGEIGRIEEKYGIKNKFIFYFGSIFFRRHLEDVLKSFSRLARDSKEYQFLVGGNDYTTGRAVDKLAKKINLELKRNAVLRVDFMPDFDVKLLCSACTFFVWLSDYEGFGLPVLEAMANGAPVITTNGTSLREVADDAAIQIRNNGDFEEIYRAMKELMGNEELRMNLSEKGRVQAARFSWKECAKRTFYALISA